MSLPRTRSEVNGGPTQTERPARFCVRAVRFWIAGFQPAFSPHEERAESPRSRKTVSRSTRRLAESCAVFPLLAHLSQAERAYLELLTQPAEQSGFCVVVFFFFETAREQIPALALRRVAHERILEHAAAHALDRFRVHAVQNSAKSPMCR